MPTNAATGAIHGKCRRRSEARGSAGGASQILLAAIIGLRPI